MRASRSLNIRLRSPVRRKKLYWFYRLLRRKLSVKSNVLRWSVKHDREIRGKEKLINVTDTIGVWIKIFSFFLFQRGGVWHTCPMHPNRCDSSTVVDESSHRMSNCALTERKPRGARVGNMWKWVAWYENKITWTFHVFKAWNDRRSIVRILKTIQCSKCWRFDTIRLESNDSSQQITIRHTGCRFAVVRFDNIFNPLPLHRHLRNIF